MKRSTYMSKDEMIDWIKVGVLASEADAIAARTPEADWRKKLKTAATMCSNIITERLRALDRNQLKSVVRRKEHSSLRLYTSDQLKVDTERERLEPNITLETEDYYDILDMALLSCMKCAQGEVVTDCRMREIYHRLGVPIARENPKVGECEFRADNEVKSITPQYRKMGSETV